MKNQFVSAGRKIAAAGILVVMLAAGSISVLAAPKVKKINYDGNGKVEVDFKKDVEYKNVKVKVTDSAGNTSKAKIVDKDEDDLDFVISGWKRGETYSFKITGIRALGDTAYGSVKGSVSIPKKITVEEIDYDEEDKIVEISFKDRVQWKNAKIKITKSGKNYVTKVKKLKSDEAEVKVKKLKVGKKYRLVISGIRLKGTSKYTTLKKTFVAVHTD